ncbi:MAG: hypothetical protein PHT88_00175 [Candidatus Moranbacteria bacterium]|nr:hypothetical protein [Candidatus Moranbacteria bacterium]
MGPKDIRKKILEMLYSQRSGFMVKTDDLINSFKPKLDDPILHQEIEYLKGKGFLETQAEFMGREYLYFAGLKITPIGIDLVENPEEFGKLFNVHINNFGNISQSNVVASSSNINQSINVQTNDISPEILELLQQLKKAIEDGDIEKKDSLLQKLRSGAENVFWNLVASGIYTVIQK